jgi:hypothetical protein
MVKTKLMIGGLVLALTFPLAGQGKKTIAEKGIVSRTVEEYFIGEGMNEPVVESVEKYNEKGELTELRELNRKGDVKKWERYVYDEKGNLVEEVFLDQRGKVERTERTIYEDGLKTEKHYLDQKGNLYKKKVYVYEYRQ